ncbi:hypothetical protein [Microbacterium trichothecenolyticum]|uniref:Uncharacterized protein n=1 Tax=Microbacterium trichothecenolyticum TaxID=69370 RepID=A0ABU0TR76_MICTR|nr:hypothetical protein [Microbacterium trichothecenolyticum]MDQ1122168.1 hypothetical protein [Microbacterium trichothecenolyticum]
MSVDFDNMSPFLRAATRTGSHEGPALLFDWFYSGRLTGAELSAAVPYVWSSAKQPFRALTQLTWIELFQAAGYTEDCKPAERPQAPLTLYRASEPQYAHRLAWTGSLATAERFLEINKRYGDRPRFVYMITVAATDRVLAHITDRDEDEYIVDTRGLRAKRIDTTRKQADS